MKTKELDHLIELSKAKQELKAKRKEVSLHLKEDKLDFSQGISSTMVVKPSPYKSKKKKDKNKNNQVPHSPMKKKDKQPKQGVLKRPQSKKRQKKSAPKQDKRPRKSAPKQDKKKQATTNHRGSSSHFIHISYKCHIKGHIGPQCANMKW
ncbi:hypothetical protein Ddye_008576 [Dipteronia dyeriana]|uniref:Uncharacterized protein n=1 Tax=Dipteronia dyeriana TaxID=168575 RepID=A0AAE0CLI1_9ROSI|nr:hypothetical protein Ddye_008576 [Dipteronia dyeriana]